MYSTCLKDKSDLCWLQVPRVLSVAGSDSGGGAGIQVGVVLLPLLQGHQLEPRALHTRLLTATQHLHHPAYEGRGLLGCSLNFPSAEGTCDCLQADLKTCAALGVYASTAITALTAQNTHGVGDVHISPVSRDLLRA
jgi:Phosphomethylpyrimidine kinase